MSEDEKVMVCIAAEEGRVPVAGSMVTACHKCGKGLWISQESLFEHPDAKAICFDCAEQGLLREDAEFPQVENGNPMVAAIVAAIKRGWRP